MKFPADMWKYRIDSFAAHQSGQHGTRKWKMLRHLSWLVDQIQPLLMQGNARIMVSMPPQHGKSRLISVWLVIWWLSMHPTDRVLLASYEASQASRWGRLCRDYFKGHGQIKSARSGSNDWELLTGGSMQTAGVGGPLTSASGELMIADDLHKNWDEAHSKVKLETLHHWFASTFMTRKQTGSNILLVGTRWNNTDAFAWVREEYAQEDWTVIELAAIAEANDPMGRPVGDPLCSELHTAEDLLKVKQSPSIGPTIWSSMYQQRPEIQGGNIWKRDWFQYWSELPDNLTRWTQSWDMNLKKTGKSWVCGQVWACHGPDRYLIDQVRGRWEFVEIQRQLLALRKRWPKTRARILIEDAANGPAVMSSLRRKIGGMIPVLPYGSKPSRAMAVQGLFEARNVYVPARTKADWVQGYIDECAVFPAGTADDQVDTTSQALSKLMGGGGIRIGSLGEA